MSALDDPCLNNINFENVLLRDIKAKFQKYEERYLKYGVNNIENSKCRIIPHYLIREALQTPAAGANADINGEVISGGIRVPFPEELSSLLNRMDETVFDDRQVIIEMNGAGQLNGIDYTRECVEHILRNTQSIVALHCGSTLGLAKDSIDLLSRYQQEFGDRILLKVYARLNPDADEEYNPAGDLSQIFEYANSVGFGTSSFRVGLEHNGPLWVHAIRNNDIAVLRKFISRLTELYLLCRDAGVRRVSIPETRGTLLPHEAYAYTMSNLELMLSIGMTPDEVELHFHNDLGNTAENTKASCKAFEDFNYFTGNNVRAGINFTVSGAGERNGISSLSEVVELLGRSDDIRDIVRYERSILNIHELIDVRLQSWTRYHTAGTHGDYFAKQVIADLRKMDLSYSSWEEIVDAVRSDAMNLSLVRTALAGAISHTYSEGISSHEEDNSFHILITVIAGWKMFQMSQILSGIVPSSVEESRAIVSEIKSSIVSSLDKLSPIIFESVTDEVVMQEAKEAHSVFASNLALAV